MMTSPFKSGFASRHSPQAESRVMNRGACLALSLSVFCINACAPQEVVKPPASEPPAPLAAGDARTFTKLIEGSVSSDHRFAVAVGTADRSRPDWVSVTQADQRPSYQLTDSSNTANYLVSLSDFQVLGRLDSNHSGSARSYNHEFAAFHWSLDSRWLVEEHHWKWHTAQCTVHRLDPNGHSLARLDLRPAARSVLLEQFLRSVAEAKPKDFDRYAIQVEVTKIVNDGIIQAKLTAQVPKEEAPYLEVEMAGRVSERDGKLELEVIRP